MTRSFPHSQYNRDRYRRTMAKLQQDLGGICVKCGSSGPLQFDHRDPSTKSFDIAEGVATKGMPAVLEELKKCQLLCQDCHSEKTVIDVGYAPKGMHGTLNMYSHQKCRCPECRSAWNTHSRDYRRKRKEDRAQSL